MALSTHFVPMPSYVSVLPIIAQHLPQNNGKHGIIHLPDLEKFPKNQHFLPPDTQTCVCVPGGKKC